LTLKEIKERQRSLRFMDTQIKLSIFKSDFKGNKPSDIDKIITMNELDTEYKNKPLFEFKEYEKVSIYFDLLMKVLY
jgi:hypothetical protein